MRTKIVLGLGIGLATSVCSAAVYQCKDADGNSILSNRPGACEQAQGQQPTPPPVSGETPPHKRQAHAGSGFAVGVDLIVTNEHVVHDCDRIRMMPDRAIGTVVAKDTKYDLALIRTTARFARPVTFRVSPNLGEDVVVGGYPLPSILESTLNITQGTVSSLGALRGTGHYFQITAPIQPGNSGGPVFDRAGHVIGVASASLSSRAVAAKTGLIPQNVNFAVRPEAVIYMLRDAGVKAKATDKAGEPLSTRQIAEEASHNTVQVYCFED